MVFALLLQCSTDPEASAASCYNFHDDSARLFIRNNSLLIANSNWPWLDWIQSNFSSPPLPGKYLRVRERDSPCQAEWQHESLQQKPQNNSR